MNLKTLKDLKPKDIIWLQGLNEKQQDGIIREIQEWERQEAIKWIKEMHIEEEKGRDNYYAVPQFKHFFNITEEDLK